MVLITSIRHQMSRRTACHRCEKVDRTPRLCSSNCLVPFWYVSLLWSTDPFYYFLCRRPWPGPSLWHGWEWWRDLWLLTCSVPRPVICWCFLHRLWHHVVKLLAGVPVVELQMLCLSPQYRFCYNSYTVFCRHIHRRLPVWACLWDVLNRLRNDLKGLMAVGIP